MTKTYEEVKNFIEVESNSGCLLLSEEYINSNSALKIQCKCGREFSTILRSFQYSGVRQCGVCSGHEYDYTAVKEFIELNSDCSLLSDEYINNTSPLLLKCKCGNTFETTFNRFKHKNKKQCNTCSYKRPKLHNAYFNTNSNTTRFSYGYVKKYIEEDSESGCILLSKEYKNIMSKLSIKCKCGQIFSTSFNNFKGCNKRHCDACGMKFRSDKNRLTYEYVKNYIEVESGSGCKLLSETYESTVGKLSIECKCGRVFNITFSKFKYKKYHHCNACSRSNGELVIENFLDRYKIKCTRQYGIEECRNERILSFDLAVFNDNQNLILLIEYDGQQHFRPVNFGGCSDEVAEEEFLKIQKRDDIKNQYCNDNEIPLLRIPYWSFNNIDEILMNQMNKYGLIDNESQKIM